MKYLIKGTAVKFNHKVYEIGDEITLSNVPKSLKHLLEPVKEHRILSGAEALVAEPVEAQSNNQPIDQSANPVAESVEVSKKPKKKTEK